MIIITGAAGFIASCLIRRLNQDGFNNLILVDDFSRADKQPNLQGKKFVSKLSRMDVFSYIEENHIEIEFILHIGARTNTAEFDIELLRELNVVYSQKIWEYCVQYQIPLIYASSAATYGLGEQGYNDDENMLRHLKPLNPYGISKNEFDIWAVEQERKPFFWVGLKFFNVFGPNEYHKGRMASVVFHAFHQIQSEGYIKLFRSHRPDFADGEQKRDFIYVLDVVDVIRFFMDNRKHSGLYNLGTGQARTFLDLAKGVFSALKKPENIRFIDTPEDIRDKYQYFTQANMQKLRSIGYKKPFTPLEEAISDYVQNYLLENRYF